MTLVTLPNLLLVPNHIRPGHGNSPTPTLMDAANEGAAWKFRAPKAGNIRKIGFMVGSVTTPQSLDIRLETLDSSMAPTGTLWGTTTNGAVASPTADTWFWVTLTSDAVVAKHDNLCAVVRWSGTAGNLNINYTAGGTGPAIALCAAMANTNGSTWSNNGGCPNFAIEYDDGSRPWVGGFPMTVGSSGSLNTASTPDEWGFRATFNFRGRVWGIWMYPNSISSGGTLGAKLYDMSNHVLASGSGFDHDFWLGLGGFTHLFVPFSTPYILEPGVEVRGTILPETTTGVIKVGATIDSAGTRESHMTGLNFQRTQRTDAGAWSDSATEIPYVGLAYDQLEDGASFKRHPGMSGGIAA